MDMPPVMNRIHSSLTLWAALLMVAALTGCDAPLSPEQKRERAIAAIGMEASLTAGMFVSAVRSCDLVGLNDIERCAQLKGSLAAEQTAQMYASMVVNQSKEYWKNCQTNFPLDYCDQLIQRAVAIEYRRPGRSE